MAGMTIRNRSIIIDPVSELVPRAWAAETLRGPSSSDADKPNQSFPDSFYGDRNPDGTRLKNIFKSA
jgi:hypothetical protein